MLRAEHLTKRFGSVTALADVSFDLRAGEIHALCGENGAGKSTLIKLLSGVHPHGSYQGRFELDGREANFASIRDAQAAGIAVIYQELSCIDEMSVAENLFLGRPTTRYGVFIDRGAAERRAAAALARFGVSLDPAAPMRSLGIGQKQLVEIVKALLRESRILILDEPTAALAEHEVEVLLAILRDLRASGIGLIYISHRLEELAKIADRVTVLRDGATVASMPIASRGAAAAGAGSFGSGATRRGSDRGSFVRPACGRGTWDRRTDGGGTDGTAVPPLRRLGSSVRGSGNPRRAAPRCGWAGLEPARRAGAGH